MVWTRAAHGPGRPAGREGRAGPGPGRADLLRPAGRTGRKRAEVFPWKKQGLHEKTKISCKSLIKFTLDKEIFLKNFRGLRPWTPYLLRRFSIIFFYFNDIWILCEIFILLTKFQSKSISTGPTGGTGRAEIFFQRAGTGRAEKIRPVRTSSMNG